MESQRICAERFLLSTGPSASNPAQVLCLPHIQRLRPGPVNLSSVSYWWSRRESSPAGPSGASTRVDSASFLTPNCGILQSPSGPQSKPQAKGRKNMKSDFLQNQTSRREMLRDSVTLAGSAFLAHLFPATLLRASTAGYAQQAPSPAEMLANLRAQRGSVPIEAQKLADNLTLLSGPGGNVVVLNGPDGKFVVDTFLSPAWPKLKEALDTIGSAPVKFVIDTHWHFDHTDNNAPLHAAGATILGHENTKKRMSEPHDLPVFGLHL